MKSIKLICLAAVMAFNGTLVWADSYNNEEENGIKPLRLSGFRIGASYMLGAKADELKDALHDDGTLPILSQFGWQHEFRFPAGNDGLAAVVEIVGLVGGLNLGLVIPSLNLPIGIRSTSGWEIGAGPHISMGQVDKDPKVSSGFVVAGGMTRKVGKLNIPLNFAFMQGRTQGSDESGYSLTLLSGFAF